jgi:hypothetical protein
MYVCLFECLFVCLSVCLFVCLSVCLSVCLIDCLLLLLLLFCFPLTCRCSANGQCMMDRDEAKCSGGLTEQCSIPSTWNGGVAERERGGMYCVVFVV